MTKSEMFERIKELCFDNQNLIDFCNEEIYKIQHKKNTFEAKAKDKDLDELAKKCLDILKQSEEPITAEEILYKLNYEEDLTIAKVRARLSQLIKCEYINRGTRIEFDKYEVVYYIKGE
jgi:hypothetical protein